MDTQTVVMFGNLVIFNAATIKILTAALSKIDIKSALSEKNLAPEATSQPGMALNTTPPTDITSYSRVAGFIGASVMATFFWALGNIILYKAFTSLSEIHDLLASLATYFIAGSSLFLPYALNQLKAVFS